MLVADTNLIAYLWIQGDHTAEAERLLQKDPVWAVPLLWRSEFRNLLAGYVRSGNLSLELAVQLAEEAERFLAGREYGVPSPKVLETAIASRCSAYDCEFVVLAEDLGVKLVTTDREILKAFPRRAVSVRQFLTER